jgi:hypothetical protein
LIDVASSRQHHVAIEEGEGTAVGADMMMMLGEDGLFN